MSSQQIHEAQPYLRIQGAAKAIEFYQAAFGAEEDFRLTDPDGRVGHAQLKFGAAVIMLSDEYPEMNILGPNSIGGTGTSIHLRVEDVDGIVDQARKAGAEVVREPKDEFYGFRSAKLRDPFGHEWDLGKQVEEVTPEEMQKRFDAMFS